MGALFAKIQRLFDGFDNESRVLMLGLDAAGKTTVLYKLQLGEVVTTIPTIGFNVESIKYKNLTMSIFDVGGQHKIRPLWKHYFQGADALIYVVDSADRERLPEAAEELQRVLSSDDMRHVSILVMANKQDCSHAASVKDIASAMGLNKERSRRWHVQSTVAVTGDGLFEGLDWMATAIKETRKEVAAARP